MFKKRPYFMKNKSWFNKIKLKGHKEVYELTELGKSIPEVFKSHLEFYNHKMEDIFSCGGTDVNSEFVLSTTKKMKKDLKQKGLSEDEIEKNIYDFIHIEETMSNEEKLEATKQFQTLDREFNEWYKQKNIKKKENENIENSKQNRSSNSIIKRIKNKRGY